MRLEHSTGIMYPERFLLVERGVAVKDDRDVCGGGKSGLDEKFGEGEAA